MDKDRKPVIRRPDVLKKLNAENVQLIERCLLGDLPDRFKPSTVPVRGHSRELVVAKSSGLLSSCLPIIPDTPSPEKISSDDEAVSPLKKSFSFRDKFRINLFGKDKIEKHKCKTIVEDERSKEAASEASSPSHETDKENKSDSKSSKRFWFFRNRELMDKKTHSPIYTRSKSFEFLPRAMEEEESKVKLILKKNSLSYAFGSSDTLGDTSVDSLEYIADVYYDKADNVFLKSIKELQDSDHNSFASTSTSISSGGLVVNMLKTESVQDLLDEFDKTVDMFSENYLSDCEPYTRTFNELAIDEKRKSISFTTLPSPKILHVNKANRISEEFKTELNQMLVTKRHTVCTKSPRRGSVTDWFVLEDQSAASVKSQSAAASEANKYRRAQKKPTQRVRRISSTKYVSTYR
ncbi:unnamed protein product, partial [Brenthis ino]